MRILVPDQPHDGSGAAPSNAAQRPSAVAGRLSDAWRFCVGAGRFELALRRDYLDSLSLIQREIGFGHIRQHGLLSDGVGVYRPYQHQGSWPVGSSSTSRLTATR